MWFGFERISLSCGLVFDLRFYRCCCVAKIADFGKVIPVSTCPNNDDITVIENMAENALVVCCGFDFISKRNRVLNIE